MHVMVATDGSIDSKKTAAIATSLAGDGQITVYTVIEVPREMLNDMREASAADTKIQEISVEHRTKQAGDPPVSHWVGDDAVVASYVKQKVKERTAGLAAELEAAGANYTVVGEEGESAARSVLPVLRAPLALKPARQAQMARTAPTARMAPTAGTAQRELPLAAGLA